MEERCKNCKFYSKLKIHIRYSIGIDRSRWQETHCCLMFAKTENEPYVIEVQPDDRCEMFCSK